MLELKTHIVNLYQHILDFQFRSILRFYRSWPGNLGRDIFHHEDWKQMQSTIIDLENAIHRDLEQMNTLLSTHELGRLSRGSKKSLETMQQLLSAAGKRLQVTMEHRDISLEQPQVQKEIAKRMLSQEEEECHQLSRLTHDNKNGSYEWYKNRVEDRVESTCQWFLNHENFKKWLEQDSGPLLVSADPGCGKSVLAKYLIDHKLPLLATVCYFFKD